MNQPAQYPPAASDRPRPADPYNYDEPDPRGARPQEPAQPYHDAPLPVEPEQTDAERLRAEAQAEQDWPDGTVGVMLYTDRGEELIHVPPQNTWRSTATAALFSRNDSLTWAVVTLSFEEASAWERLDPTGDDVQKFFAAWGRITGQSLGESRASRRSSKSTRGR